MTQISSVDIKQIFANTAAETEKEIARNRCSKLLRNYMFYLNA